MIYSFSMKTEIIHEKQRMKHINPTIGRRNAVIKNIYRIINSAKTFVIVGHVIPDEDCFAALTASALLLDKLHKKTVLFLTEPFPDQLQFLASICQYNNIPVYYSQTDTFAAPDVLCILDTPKPSMIAGNPCIHRFMEDRSIPKIELDHHLYSDAAFCGDEDSSLAMRASSTCEILCLLCFKLLQHPKILAQYGIDELFSRNIALSLLTGMLGDAKMGNYLYKTRDKKVFHFFTQFLNGILKNKTVPGHENSNITSIEKLFCILETTNEEEKKLYTMIMKNAVYTEKTGRIILNESESAMLTNDIDVYRLINTMKNATNELAETIKGVGISVFYDYTVTPYEVQCRIRGSSAVRGINLHAVIEHFDIKNGGGHPGAIALRIQPKTHKELMRFIDKIESFIVNTLLV